MKFKKKYHLFSIISLTIILVDQIIKKLILDIRPNFEFLFFKINFITNTGAGFGILKGNSFLLGFVSLFVAILILYNYKRFPKNNTFQILLALFFAGTVSNMFDRFFREYVIDYVGTNFWPSFNLADTCITISTIGLIIYLTKNDLFINEKK